GWFSRATKSRLLLSDAPISMPMYDPEISVLSPVTLAPEIRGRTTQNCVSSTRNPSVFGSICAVATTLRWSSERRLWVRVPMSAPLYSIFVFPASSPSADLKTMVICGPWPRMRVTATQVPASAATIGTIHTSDSRVCRLGTRRDSEIMGSGMLNLSRAHRIPDQARIERLHRQHREHHDRCEEEETGRRLDGHERLQLHERGRERVDEHVDHRPATDQLDHAVEPDALCVVLDG